MKNITELFWKELFEARDAVRILYNLDCWDLDDVMDEINNRINELDDAIDKEARDGTELDRKKEEYGG